MNNIRVVCSDMHEFRRWPEDIRNEYKRLIDKLEKFAFEYAPIWRKDINGAPYETESRIYKTPMCFDEMQELHAEFIALEPEYLKNTALPPMMELARSVYYKTWHRAQEAGHHHLYLPLPDRYIQATAPEVYAKFKLEEIIK